MTSSSNKLARRNGHLSSLVERSSYHNDLWDREIKENSLFTRDEEIRLVRRVSVGAKIKHAFQVSYLNVWIRCTDSSTGIWPRR